MFDEESLLDTNYIIKDKQIAAIINTCVNCKIFNLDDGELGRRNFNTDIGYAKYLDSLYHTSYQLVEIRNTIYKSKRSLVLDMILSLFKNMKDDIKLTSVEGDGTSDLTYLLSEWNKYSDRNQVDTYQQSCSKSIQDYWAQNSNLCPKDYTLIDNGSQVNDDKFCLLYTNWSYQNIALRYSSSPDGCKDPKLFPSVNDAIIKYFTKIVNYSAENEKLLNSLINDFKKIDKDFSTSSEILLEYLIKIHHIIDPLVNVFEDVVGNKNLFEFINCSKNL
jgi:hypothetical protein